MTSQMKDYSEAMTTIHIVECIFYDMVKYFLQMFLSDENFI